MNAIFTIVSKSYLPYARTLGDSLRASNPGLAFLIVLVDGDRGDADLKSERFPIISPESLSIPSFREFRFKYDVVECCTALKPFAIKYLLKQAGYAKVIYLDPDIYVYRSLAETFEMLDTYAVLLTPHITSPSVGSDGTLGEQAFLQHGVFNLGFIGIADGRTGEALLDWWEARTESSCFADVAEGLYVDQKWADLFPCLGGEAVGILRDPGYNVAHWNWHERAIERRDGVLTVNGRPLVFYHFSGFDPCSCDSVTRGRAANPIGLDDLSGELHGLFVDYRARLLENGSREGRKDYAFNFFANGGRIDPFERRLYRGVAASGRRWDDPFETGADSFFRVLERSGLRDSEHAKRQRPVGGSRPRSEREWRALRFALRILRRVLGTARYFSLLRALSVVSRPEEQTFLLRK